MSNYKIHVAYGFHVNCYHSYRGDTNDNFGFGSDIRIINQILDVLTELNEKGIPVKGTWDSENFFSLEKILPEYAPEIIEKIKERVKKYGDENIIMGYNNGALSAMTEDEFSASIDLAVTNPKGSGLMDIFGEYEKIVRPQEVMFSPSQVKLYNKLGVKALCLYYSCVPFDAFRTIVPKLSDEAAFNPLTFTYEGESLTVVPTYSNCDVCDSGCLRGWVKELHKKQESGEIKNDLFIFINMDADAIFWETIKLGKLTGKIANTDGIRGLVTEISDLPYIVYDTVGGYLKNHKPIGKIEFRQDTADGNYTGYSSWAEKPFNRKIWTELEKARAMAKVNSAKDADSPSFMDRVLLLSTTHFGLATPVLNIQREKTAVALAEKSIESERNALLKTEKLTVHNITDSAPQCVQLKINEKVNDVRELKITGKDLKSYTVIAMDENCSSVYAMMKFKKNKKKYEIEVSKAEIENEKAELCDVLSTERLTFKFSKYGKIYRVFKDGEMIGDENFLKSFLTYDGKKYEFEKKSIKPLLCGGNGEGVSVSGEIHLPEEIASGRFTFDFFKTDFSDAVFVRTKIKYPFTKENYAISTENSSLGRYTDIKWEEAAPFQITPVFKGDLSVVRRNFMDDVSSYRTRSFKECDSKNSSLASFNHHLTGGFVGLTNKTNGIILANARQVLNSMANCPMRLREDETIHMNPFGTYDGPQRHHWGRAKDEVLGTYTLVSAQGKSLAPSYNGVTETAVSAFFPFDGEKISDEQLSEINAFSDGAVVTAPESSIAQPFYGCNVEFTDTKEVNISENELKNPIAMNFKGNLGKYVTKGTRAISHIIREQLKARK